MVPDNGTGLKVICMSCTDVPAKKSFERCEKFTDACASWYPLQYSEIAGASVVDLNLNVSHQSLYYSCAELLLNQF